MLVLDNSAYSLNGDYARAALFLGTPSIVPGLTMLPLPHLRSRAIAPTATRLAAQADAVHILFNNKLNANPENEVGLMVMGGKAYVCHLRHS